MKKSKLGMDLKISRSSTKSSTGGGANFAWFGRKLDGNGENGFPRRSAVTGREKKIPGQWNIFFIFINF